MQNKYSGSSMKKHLLMLQAWYITKFKQPLIFELIKIHGGNYQENALPDLLIMIATKTKRIHLWLEAKKNWQDEPDKLQRWNVEERLRKYYITGYVAGDEYKQYWKSSPEKISTFLEEMVQ